LDEFKDLHRCGRPPEISEEIFSELRSDYLKTLQDGKLRKL